MSRRHSQILGLGGYRPAQVVDNQAVAERLGLDPEWIRIRSGVQRRRYANPGETLAVMGSAAAAKALAAAGLEPARIGGVIVATGTHLKQFPAVAVEVADRLAADHVGAFDLTAACAGFPYALAVGSGMVCFGGADYVVVVGAERMTDIVDPGDRATSFLFADGAGAVVIGPADEPGISPVVWGSDQSRTEAVGMSGFWVPELRTDANRAWPVLQMTGWRVYRWATEHLAGICQRALDRAGITIDELDAFIPHQANALITGTLARQLQLPARVVVADDITESGNTSAASIPLAMDALVNSGRLGSGAMALLVGFGSGLVYAAQVVRVP